MDPEDRALLRDLIGELRALRQERAAREAAPLSPIPYQPGAPLRYEAGCNACRLSGVCNCILGGPQVWCADNTGCAPAASTFTVMPANAQPIYTWTDPCAGAAAPIAPIAVHAFRTGGSKP